MKAHNAASRKMSRHHDVESPSRIVYPGISLSRHISSRKRESTSMASEYLILTEIASNLSTYVQNRVSDDQDDDASSSVQDINKGKIDLLHNRGHASNKATGTISDDAKLLLNFKEAAPRSETSPSPNERFPMTISPSFSFEARRYQQQHCAAGHSHRTTSSGARPKRERDQTAILKPRVRFQQCDSERTFSFAFPSLSLSEHHTHVPIETIHLNNTNSTTASASNISPSQLFSRIVRKQSTLDVHEVADTLANNVMLSFITALEWRTKTWIKDLSKKLTTSFHQEVANIPKESFSAVVPPKRKKSAKNAKNATGKKNIDSRKKSSNPVDELKAKFKKSQEARVIKALTQTWSTVHVHDVRTTFFVLERQYDDDTGAADGSSSSTDDSTTTTASTSTNDASYSHEEEKKMETESYTPFLSSEVFRPLKKRRTVTDDFSVEQEQPRKFTKYTLSHVLNLDSRCSVSTSSEERISVSLQTPGVIHGTFVRDEDGEAFLVDLSIDLDTENLAVTMEQKSRFVVRTAAEECIVSPPCVTQLRRQTSKGWKNCTTSKVSTNASNGNSRGITNTTTTVIKPRESFKTLAPVTPFATQPERVVDAALVTPNENGFVSSDSEDMPPPPPRLPMTEAKQTNFSFLNPRRVSPTSDLQPMSNCCVEKMVSPVPQKATISYPALVSPNMYGTKGVENVMKGNGPSLPALVEVACAAHTGSIG